MDAGIIAMRNALQLCSDDVGHVADGAGRAQRADNRGSEGAGAAGDDHMRAVISDHGCTSLLMAPLCGCSGAGDITAASPAASADRTFCDDYVVRAPARP